MRGILILIVAMGICVSLMAPQKPRGSSHVPDEAQQSSDDQTVQTDELKAKSPQYETQDGTLSLQRSKDGHFYADVRINGTYVHMLVDTGASVIALSRQDAQSAGIATSIGMNDIIGQGADGPVHGEFARLDNVELGPLSASGLEAIVLNSGNQSLLGQSFLSKFDSVQIEGDRMILRENS